MKIITNSDIKRLIIYAKRNLGIYKLVYRPYKQLYFTIMVLLLIFALLLMAFLYDFVFYKKISPFIVILCMSVILSEFVLLSILYRKTKIPHFKIQIKRIELLKKYYSYNNLGKEEIEIVNNLLQQRIDTIKSNNIKASAVIISLLLPLWNLYINKLGKSQSMAEIFSIIIPRVIIITILIALIYPIYNFIRITVIETILVMNNVYLIKNLIYLNSYILKENSQKESRGRKNGKRRKRRC